ncbi:pentatricopeptide repeat-containing protein At5g46580, chloroplastic-like [Impatiens glandulifera]|uniref:pentatricopeptide repeat-containing protein At5g46580, chloroplastic-like n=1 Tax=Impatiens glandulifera TaxID=253017 RepID=UPI001FB0C561|nr:pentatricopeptide repeat-containing protein At5g46580, chloroplastic-like [Impatiens glandulifera]
MATTLSISLDVHRIRQQTQEPKRPTHFKSPMIHLPTRRRFKLHCASSKTSPKPPPDLSDTRPRNPSLSDQLKSISTTTTVITDDPPPETQLNRNPKSTWVNPTRPKPSVLTLNRQKKSQYSYNPQIRSLKQFAFKLNECGPSEEAFIAALAEIPQAVTRDSALLLLNNLKPWQKTLIFFNWIRTQKLFPMETIFYNVAMKSLRFGKQFQTIEELAFDMINTGVELDNITYSTVITSAKRCGFYDKALEWFERMYKTGVMPDEVTYSSILDVYAKLGKVEDVMSFYDRGKASGWKPDSMAFSILGKMFGETGDYDGIRFVLEEMKSLDVKPNLVLYNTLLEALGKAGKPGLARTLFEEMVESGVDPDEKTLTALVKIYGKARWGKDALELWERMRSNGWPMDFFLYNTLLGMCADLGLVEEGETLFNEMKGSRTCKLDSWSYTAMLNIYGSGGNPEKAMEVFDEMSKSGIDLNVMGCTCLIQCLGRAKRIDDLVSVFEFSIKKGIKPDDRLCGCLMSVVSFFNEPSDIDKVLVCLQKANQELAAFIRLLEDDETTFDAVKEKFKQILTATSGESRRPFCNCLIDICRNRGGLHERAHELLYLGTMFGLYPSMHSKNKEEWHMNVRSLSVGAALTALEEWMRSVKKMVERGEEGALPEMFTASTGAGTHKFSQGLAKEFDDHVKKIGVPFKQGEDQAGLFIATKEDLLSWVATA